MFLHGGNPRVNAFAQVHPMFLHSVNMVRYPGASFVATRFTIPLATPGPGRSESIVVSWKSRFLVFPGHPQPFQKRRAETLRKTGALNLTLDQVSWYFRHDSRKPVKRLLGQE